MGNSNTYVVGVYCKNCGWHGLIEVGKGVYVEFKECPCCGCKTLENKNPYWDNADN